MNRAAAAATATTAVLVSAAIGSLAGPQHPSTAIWYARLRKPGFTPPGWVFGPAWGVLDTLMAVSGGRLLAAAPSRERTTALAGWATVVAGLAAYPQLAFGQRQLGGGVLLSAGMLAGATTTVVSSRRVDPVASAAGVPLVGWLGFALLLGEEVWRRNRGRSRVRRLGWR